MSQEHGEGLERRRHGYVLELTPPANTLPTGPSVRKLISLTPPAQITWGPRLEPICFVQSGKPDQAGLGAALQTQWDEGKERAHTKGIS